MGRNVVAEFVKQNAANAPSRVKWEAKYPEFALAPDRDVPSRIDADSTGWIKSPSTSAHVDSFRKWFPFTPLGREMSGGTYRIYVRFRASPTQGMSEYEYHWKNAAEARRVWGLLTTDPHPGEVIHREMILKGVPYQRVAQDGE